MQVFSEAGNIMGYACRFHSTVETDLGENDVFDMLHDYDVEISRAMNHYFHAQSLSAEELGRVLKNFRSYMNVRVDCLSGS